MKNIPVSTAFALEKLEAALKEGDMEEVAKWNLCIRGNNDLRIRAKHHQRQAKNASLLRELKRSYDLKEI